MNYEAIYDRLIRRARTRQLESYTERHHIVPKCLGGGDVAENLVDLTPEEHYVAHQLLVRMYPNNGKLVYAAAAMGNMRGIANKEYGWLKRRRAQLLSEERSGSNHPMFGQPGTMTGRKHTEEAKRKMRMPRSEYAKRNMAKPKGSENPNFGRTRTDTSKRRMRKPKPDGFGQETRNSMFGKEHTPEAKAKMSDKARSRKRAACIHCGKEMPVSHIARYHNDRCKERA